MNITSTIIRVKGEGFIRRLTKSSAGQRLPGLPAWAVAMLRRRFMAGVVLYGPEFSGLRRGLL